MENLVFFLSDLFSDLLIKPQTMADKGEKEGLKENIFFIEEEYKKVRLELQKISENGLS